MAKMQHFYRIMDEQERKVIRWALKKGGSITEAGIILGLNRPTLSMKMKRLGLTEEYHTHKMNRLKMLKEKLNERLR